MRALAALCVLAACTGGPQPQPRSEREAQLAQAEQALAAAPGDADAQIWVGRRLAYLGRYREAIAAFSRGIEQHPRDARFYRHRGHRWLTLRDLPAATADLERATALIDGQRDAIEPDGQPNARNIPTSTLHFNIHYHLGLAHYLAGRFEQALVAYRRCLTVSDNPDALCAVTHWLYMTLRRLGRADEAARALAPIDAGMDVIENHDYHALLLMYRGERDAEALLAAAGDAQQVGFSTLAYGIANWHLYNGREEQARALLQRIVASGNQAAFGYIAAEAELARGR
jgi:tetratricopeptide (TPR) repeat protein